MARVGLKLGGNFGQLKAFPLVGKRRPRKLFQALRLRDRVFLPSCVQPHFFVIDAFASKANFRSCMLKPGRFIKPIVKFCIKRGLLPRRLPRACTCCNLYWRLHWRSRCARMTKTFRVKNPIRTRVKNLG